MDQERAVDTQNQDKPQCGVVVIGRNEGERLRVCLQSVSGNLRPVVYVDSGSTDGSIELARGLGARIVHLDTSIPFTAARARNEGFEALLKDFPSLRKVQFVDGDCEVVSGWLDRAESELDANPRLAVVCGRRRERYPEHSVYNRLCDIEWNTPVGEATACGGDAMFRVTAFQQVVGFNADLIAGEEPELCVRLRQRGWKVARVDAEMTLHDAAITRFTQWWKRAQRAGYAFAEGAAMHGALPERHWVRQARSSLVWGVVLPATALATAPATRVWSVAALAAGYASIVVRARQQLLNRGFGESDAALYALSCALAKLPEGQGQLVYRYDRLRGRKRKIIEYKR